MKAADCNKLEADKKIKKEYLSQTKWWNTILLIPPSCFIFLGLVGLIYFFKLDLLISFYSLPFILILAIGAVWLKSVKKYIFNRALNNKESFLVCLSKEIKDDGKYIYLAFVYNEKRHNSYYISSLVNDLEFDTSTEAKDRIVQVESESHDTFYVRAFKKSLIQKRNRPWTKEAYLPLLFIDNKNIFIIKDNDLAK